MSLADRVVLISGGGTGIGAATARRFAADEASVVVMGRRPGPLEALAAETGAVASPGDATSSADVRRAVDVARERFGGLDAVIANAGGHFGAGAIDTDDADWTAALAANLTSAFLLAREALPSLIERRGAIVVVASLAGHFAGPGVVGYTAAKHGLIGLTRSLARDYGPEGVRANAVCPGWVRTPMADRFMDHLAERDGISREQAYELVTRDVPLRQPAEPEQIAAVCAFLAGEESAAMTGAILMADGGASSVDLPTVAFDR